MRACWRYGGSSIRIPGATSKKRCRCSRRPISPTVTSTALRAAARRSCSSRPCAHITTCCCGWRSRTMARACKPRLRSHLNSCCAPQSLCRVLARPSPYFFCTVSELAAGPRALGAARDALETASSTLRRWGDACDPAQVRLQRCGHVDTAVGALVILHHGDQRAADREPGTVQRMHQLRLALCIAEARLHAPRLKSLAIRARRDLAVLTLPRKPYFEIVGLRARESRVARAQRHHPVRQLQLLQYPLGVTGHLFERVVRPV